MRVRGTGEWGEAGGRRGRLASVAFADAVRVPERVGDVVYAAPCLRVRVPLILEH